jgi:hypothetical protein
MAFTKGHSGNPGGRPKTVAKVRKLARKHTAAAVATLAEVMLNPDEKGAARVAAAKELLDRGHGKAPQTMEIDGTVHHEHSGLDGHRRAAVLDAIRALGASETTH